MTIEIAPPAANAKVATPTKEPSGNKEKSGSVDSSTAQKSSGFTAILAAADEPEQDGLPSSDISDSASALLSSDAPTDLAKPTAALDAASDAANLLAQALQWVANPMGVQNHLTSDPAIGKGAKSEIDLASANGVAAGINSLAGSTATPTSLALSKSGGSPLVGNAVSSIAANGVQVSAASDAGGMARKSAKDGMGTAALQSTAVSSTGNSAADVGRADDRSMTFMAQELFVKPELVKPEPVLQLVAATAKREEQSIHAAAKATTALDVTASWGAGSGAVGGASSYSAASVQDASALTPAYVAEQVSYWISNDVQSAELKLQGLGDSPVDVRISMVGNEAHVSFRTDEAKARDALENASAHLKEMLQRDGVVLSGVSVGTSGSGGAGGQEPQPRDGRQRAIVVAEAPARTEARVRGLAQTGRALDLFV